MQNKLWIQMTKKIILNDSGNPLHLSLSYFQHQSIVLEIKILIVNFLRQSKIWIFATNQTLNWNKFFG